MSTILAVDLGTTGLKTAIIDQSGKVIGAASRTYPLLSSGPGLVEQDPEEWWRAFVACCGDLSQRFEGEFAEVAAVGVCGQMHTHVSLDRDGEVLGPALTWMDQRSAALVDELNSDPGIRKMVRAETANALTTTYTAPQLMWMRQNSPDRWNKTAHVLVAKDFLKYRLSGRFVTDATDASGTLLFDIPRQRWSKAMFDLFGVRTELLPEVRESAALIGAVTEAAARATGIKTGTPVCNGSSDNSASALGAGVAYPGQAALIVGTAGVITVCSDRPVIDESSRTLCWNYCVPNHWVTLGITQTAGESLEWFRQAFDARAEGAPADAGDIFEAYSELAQAAPEGSGGLIFLPYLNGERTPYWDSRARGVFFGVGLATEKKHFVRSIMEGVSFAMRNGVEAIESLDIKVDTLRAVGGGLKSRVWLDILSSVLNRQILTAAVPDTGLHGVGLLCATALGIYPSVNQAVAATVTPVKQPMRSGPLEVYERHYSTFLQLYERIKQLFPSLGAEGSEKWEQK